MCMLERVRRVSRHGGGKETKTKLIETRKRCDANNGFEAHCMLIVLSTLDARNYCRSGAFYILVYMCMYVLICSSGEASVHW